MHARPRIAAPRPVARSVIGMLLLALALTSVGSAGLAGATTTRTVAVQPGATTSLQQGEAFDDGFGLASFSVPAVGARPLTVSVQLREFSAASGYRTSIRLGDDGSLVLVVTRNTGGVEDVLASTAVAGRVEPGERVSVQGWVHGDSAVLVRARAWVTTAPKPDWQLSYHDTSSARLTARSTARVIASVSATATVAAEIELSAHGDPEAPQADAALTSLGTATRLSPSQVGVPSGTELDQHQGDLVIREAGTVVSNLDVHGFVVVKAPDVRIRNSVVRGGVPKHNAGLITSIGQPGLVVEDVDLIPAIPSVRTDGIVGDNFTLRRVHVQGGVDSVKIIGDNVRVERSLLEKLHHFDHDPSQNNGPTHNDNVQVLTGNNIVITGTTALNTDNFAILGAAEWGDSTMTVTDNYVDGGHCNVKLAVRNGHSLRASVSGNTFGPNIKVGSCPLVAEKAVHLTASGNVSEVSRQLVVPLRI